MNNSVISQRIQDMFVFLAITDTKFLQLSRSSVKPTYFSSQVTEDIISICYKYFDQFKQAPIDHFHDELVRFLNNRNLREKERYYNYVTKIQEMNSPNQGYVIKRINDFIKAREFETAAIKFVELTEKGEFVSAKELMQKALKAGIEKEEIGLNYFKMAPPVYHNAEGLNSKLMPTGYSILDESITIHRGQFICVLGGYKGCKSWFCHHLGKQALIQGLNILHISHENTLDQTEKRYDMMLGGLCGKPENNDIQFTERDEEGNIIDTYTSKVDNVYDLSKVMESRRKIAKLGGELYIKKYPMGTCTVEEIDRYLDYLETYESFIPDVLINDYVDIMRLPLGSNASPRDRINQAYIEHKRIADERNLVIITVSQVVRSALKKAKLTQQDFAEDIRKLGNVDLVLGVAQTETQAAENVMQVYVLGNRSGPQDFGCCFSTNLNIGQMATDCWPLKQTVQDYDED